MSGFARQLFNVPNALSLFRLAAAPLLGVFWFTFDMKVTGLVLGALAGITDLFDGIIARKLKQETEIGALIDQVGDLVFESFCLLIAVLTGELWSGWLMIYLLREFTVTAMRSWVTGHGGAMPTSSLGKTKSSLLQYAFFSFFLGLILSQPGTLPDSWVLAGLHPGRLLTELARATIAVGVCVSVFSGFKYARAFVAFYDNRASGPGAGA